VPAEHECQADGCGAVENGTYRAEDDSAILPQPPFDRPVPPVLERAVTRDDHTWRFDRLDSRPDLPRAWHLQCRAVLPARAP
jgi:hypothetical protein